MLRNLQIDYKLLQEIDDILTNPKNKKFIDAMNFFVSAEDESPWEHFYYSVIGTLRKQALDPTHQYTENELDAIYEAFEWELIFSPSHSNVRAAQEMEERYRRAMEDHIDEGYLTDEGLLTDSEVKMCSCPEGVVI